MAGTFSLSEPTIDPLGSCCLVRVARPVDRNRPARWSVGLCACAMDCNPRVGPNDCTLSESEAGRGGEKKDAPCSTSAFQSGGGWGFVAIFFVDFIFAKG